MFFDKKGTDSPLDMIKLKNGSEAPRAVVVTTMMNLKSLQGSMPGMLALYDLAELCKNPSYDISYTQDTLLSLALVTQQSAGKFTVHDTVKDIVLSAVEGEGMDMALGSPVAPAATFAPGK